jgi:hypothetical protein
MPGRIKLSPPAASAELTEVTGNIKDDIVPSFFSGDLIETVPKIVGS